MILLFFSGYASAPGMPPMMAPPGAPSLPSQINGLSRPMTMNAPMMVPGSSGMPTSSGAPPPMFTPGVYQANPTAPTTAGFDSSNVNAQASEANH